MSLRQLSKIQSLTCPSGDVFFAAIPAHQGAVMPPSPRQVELSVDFGRTYRTAGDRMRGRLILFRYAGVVFGCALSGLAMIACQTGEVDDPSRLPDLISDMRKSYERGEYSAAL